MARSSAARALPITVPPARPALTLLIAPAATEQRVAAALLVLEGPHHVEGRYLADPETAALARARLARSIVRDARRGLPVAEALERVRVRAYTVQGRTCAWCGGAIQPTDRVTTLGDAVLHDGTPSRGCAMEFGCWANDE